MADPNPLTQDKIEENKLREFVIGKDSELGVDYSERTKGILTDLGGGLKIAGYDNLRKFFDGDHWSYIKSDGTPIRTYNYCRTTVINYTSFLSNEPPEDDVPPRDNQDDLEILRVEEVEKILEEVKRDNKWRTLFAEAVQNQSLLGDCFIFGPYIEWVKIEGQKKKIPRIRMKNIKRIENVRILWSSEDYNEMDGFILYYRISKQKAEQIYEDQMKERGLTSLGDATPVQYPQTTGLPMVTIKIYFDRKFMLSMADDKIVDFVKHEWGFIPGELVKNISHPTRPWGVSDIEDMLDAQVEYNEIASATRGKINQVAIPHIFYAGEGEPIEYSAGSAQMIKLGPDDKVFPDPIGQSTAPFDIYNQARKADIHQLSMISEIFYGGGNTSRATGRALSVLMQGVSNRVRGKQVFWTEALQSLNANILRLVEIYFPQSRSIIQGHYKTDIFFSAVLLRNVVDELNKFNAKLQSQYTTMKNLGIPSPKDEQKLMKKEWDDTSLAIEISRNPQLRMELEQIMQGQIADVLRNTPGGRPQLQEEDGGAGNTDEESQPASTSNVSQQPPSSAGGNVNLTKAREG